MSLGFGDRSVLKSIEYSTSDRMKTSKKAQLNLRRVEQENGGKPKTRSKSSRKDTQKYVPFSSFVGIMSEMALRNGER